MRKTVKILSLILLLLAALIGALFLARPSVIDLRRQRAEKQIIELIKSGRTDISSIKPPAMENEEEEFGELDAEPVTVTGCGLLSIPAIELEMAVVQGADSVSLRAAAGWLPESAPIGEAGNCVIFGHRMYEYGRHFNRLDELEAGDSILLYNALGACFTYEVTGKETVEPSKLMDSLAENNEGFCLTLVTCTPTGVGSHRLMVRAELLSGEQEKTEVK